MHSPSSQNTRSGVAERLKHAIAVYDLPLTAVARQFGIPYRTLQDYIAGKRAPGAEALTAFARAGIDTNWLLLGEDAPVRGGDGSGLYGSNTLQGNIPINDEELTQAIWIKANERTDAGNAAYLAATGKSLPFEVLFGLSLAWNDSISRAVLSVAGKLDVMKDKGLTKERLVAIIDGVLDAAIADGAADPTAQVLTEFGVTLDEKGAD